MFGNTYYQAEPFYAVSHGRVNILTAKFKLNKYIGLFISTLINQEQFKYSYGRAVYSNVASNMIIKLPVTASGEPDWQFMENYIKSLHCEPITTRNAHNIPPQLNTQSWKEFRVGDILDCSSTIFSIKDDLPVGNVPFVSRTAENNGVDGYVEIEADKLTAGNCLTIGAEGIYSFYQPDAFATGNKVYQLRIRSNNMNQYIALFLSTVLNIEDYKYSYGRARIMNKLQNEIIKLPADKSGEPDWQFMENYIKSLPYGDRL